jgi:DNA-binding NarL/FixJ family response regulator
MSNRAIGEHLFVSPRTVGAHLYAAFQKLGISTRQQLPGVIVTDVLVADEPDETGAATGRSAGI